MILMYHKVAPQALTYWWVSVDAFYRQMAALSSRKVVYLDDYDPSDPDQVVITFDGVYANVAQYARPILQHFGYPFELFVVGDVIGRGNEFDRAAEPPCDFASLDELDQLVRAGGRLQWHTRSHGRLDTLPPSQVAHELTVPEALRQRHGAPHWRWFAYPHGSHDPDVVQAVRQRFAGALSVVDGAHGDRWQLNRVTAHEGTSLFRGTVSIIVANYNYGRLLPEAMDSLLQQSTPPDEILLIDDASTDGSQEIVRRYENVARVEINDRNLGIVENFRKAVAMTRGDYVAILGADNRFRCDYVERCRRALDARPDAAVAYTDVLLFGPRARLLAPEVGAELIGESANEGWPLYHWTFPPEGDPRWAAFGHTKNYIHGSSMYRRADYEAVGGYRRTHDPEDWNLFKRMLARGRSAVHVAAPVLEYRQHSGRQANTVLVLEYESTYWRNQALALQARLEHLQRRPPMPLVFFGHGFEQEDDGYRFLRSGARFTVSRRELGSDSARLSFSVYRLEDDKYASLPISVGISIDGELVGAAQFDRDRRKLPFSFDLGDIKQDFVVQIVTDAEATASLPGSLVLGDVKVQPLTDASATDTAAASQGALVSA